MRASFQQLLEAAAAVLADVATSGRGPVRLVPDESGFCEAILWDRDDSGTGVSLGDGWPSQAQAALHISSQIQDALLDAGAWPVCPDHPDNHPLELGQEGVAVFWSCPTSGLQIAPLGGLS